jgi:hypothetical protein
MVVEDTKSNYKKVYRFGPKAPRWKGGRYKTKENYVWVYSPDHPYKNSQGYVKEHRLVMEKHLGRYLERWEHIHHKNGVKDDNRIENIEIVTWDVHQSIHRLNNHIDTSDRKCYTCGSSKTAIYQPANAHKTPYPTWHHLPIDKVNWYCHGCYIKYRQNTLKHREKIPTHRN